MNQKLLAAAMLTLLSGCYHTVVQTALPPSSQVLGSKWKPTFISGIISSPIDATPCAHGISRIESKVPFLQGLVGGLTYGIYTPMSVQVTCAAAPTR